MRAQSPWVGRFKNENPFEEFEGSSFTGGGEGVRIGDGICCSVSLKV
jgi:hypothetical protein